MSPAPVICRVAYDPGPLDNLTVYAITLGLLSVVQVTVIEDVVTTGGDSLRSAQVLRDAGADVIHLVVVLDREEGGEENIKNAGIPYSPLFRVQDLELD